MKDDSISPMASDYYFRHLFRDLDLYDDAWSFSNLWNICALHWVPRGAVLDIRGAFCLYQLLSTGCVDDFPYSDGGM